MKNINTLHNFRIAVVNYNPLSCPSPSPFLFGRQVMGNLFYRPLLSYSPGYFCDQMFFFRKFYSTNERISKKGGFKIIDLSNIEPLIKIVDVKISSSNITKEGDSDYLLIYLEYDYYNNRDHKQYIEMSLSDGLIHKLPLKEFHDKVMENNASVIMPKLGEYILEKSSFLE